MTDNLDGNPLIVDSTGTKVAAAASGTRWNVRIREIHWDAMTTAGHVAEIRDAAGNVKWKHTAAAANNNIQEQFESLREHGLTMSGLVVQTLGSGILYIYCD